MLAQSLDGSAFIRNSVQIDMCFAPAFFCLLLMLFYRLEETIVQSSSSSQHDSGQGER